MLQYARIRQETVGTEGIPQLLSHVQHPQEGQVHDLWA